MVKVTMLSLQMLLRTPVAGALVAGALVAGAQECAIAQHMPGCGKMSTRCGGFFVRVGTLLFEAETKRFPAIKILQHCIGCLSRVAGCQSDPNQPISFWVNRCVAVGSAMHFLTLQATPGCMFAHWHSL